LQSSKAQRLQMNGGFVKEQGRRTRNPKEILKSYKGYVRGDENKRTWHNGEHRVFLVEVGLHQGSTIILYLFRLKLNELLRGFKRASLGAWITHDLVHLEKKRTRIQTYTTISQDYVLSSWRRRHSFYVTPSRRISRRRRTFHDDVRDYDPARSITTWEDLTTRFLAQLFPSGRTAKLCNDILMLQQHHGESLSKAWTCFKDLLQKVPHHGIDLWIQYCMENPEQAFVDYTSSRTDETGGNWYTFKPEPNNLGDTYNPSWRSHPNLRWRQPQNSQRLVSNFMASQDARLSKFKADFKQQQSEMTNKIDIVLKAIIDRIAGALPSDKVKNSKLNTSPVLFARSYPIIDPQCSAHIHSSINIIIIHHKQPEESQVNKSDVGQEEKRTLGNTNSNSHPQPDLLASITTEQVRKLNSMLESLGLVPRCPNSKFVCSKEDDGEVIFIEIIQDDDEPQNKGPNEGEGATTEGPAVEYFDIFLTRDELTYHMYLTSGPIPLIFLRNPIITEGFHSNLKIPCNIGHVHIEKAYVDLNPL
nr:zinc finger, CCHC-type [Tanacetum cinerariifolium]